jgi:hypothetical protein
MANIVRGMKEKVWMTASERKQVAEFSVAARKTTETATRSRKAALQALADAGIFTASGKPKKQFR